ncbi:MAG: hypothetical protein U9Q90_01980 [Campylobacterota bacterium]|nr:hypothetical protein [Campylobacterota bacterium]
MRTLLLFSIFSIMVSANQQAMVESSTRLKSYNHRLAIQMEKENLLRRLAKIDGDKAQKIARDICKEPMRSLELTHKGQLLFYRIYTQHCKVNINALDGSVISKKSAQ